ncbi:PEP-CTERM sorting domain-containing protein [Cerasicoccus fimbriatus]|uniref:PEP-CTERM sorting domain-containing protein n=1 Tax=Cerasicoccus fimbriatus TaxID=3014554 RepID=UPI0022B35B9C|nr:PEP-CTERM sorting domain-containing protein [Cerasicoccus sp. TK19100]
MKHVIILLAASLSSASLSALDFEFKNNLGNLSSDNVWLMWQQTGGTFSVSYTNQSNQVINLTRDHFSNQLTTPIQLSDVKSMNLSNVNSGILYFGLDETGGGNPFNLSAAPSPQTATYAYEEVEMTFQGNQGDQGDLTAVNYYSFPINVQTYGTKNGVPNTPFQSSGFGTNTRQASYAQLMQTFASPTPSGYNPVIQNSNSQTVRILGPAAYYFQNGSTTQFSTGPYHTFQGYLGQVYANQQAATNPTTTTLTYSGNGGYSADVTVTQHGEPGSETYGITIDNVVSNTNTTPTPVSGSIVVNPDEAGNTPLSTLIYTGTWNDNMGTVSQAIIDSGLLDTLVASLSASFITGAVNSKTDFPGSGATPPLNEFRFQESLEWFMQNAGNATTDPGLYFEQLQGTPSALTEAYYDPFLATISELAGYSIYGSPYADRYGEWGVDLNSTVFGPDLDPVDKWVITLGTVPEPSHYAMIAGAVALLGVVWLRRRR